jgi:hypothetical protein
MKAFHIFKAAASSYIIQLSLIRKYSDLVLKGLRLVEVICSRYQQLPPKKIGLPLFPFPLRQMQICSVHEISKQLGK